MVRRRGDARPATRGAGADDLDERREHDFRVERVEEPKVFGFTWQVFGLPGDDPRRTYVEFTLVANGTGTRLTVVESGFAQLPDGAYRRAYEGNVKGWALELGELIEFLDAD